LSACPPPSPLRWRVDFNRTDLKHGAFEPQEKGGGQGGGGGGVQKRKGGSGSGAGGIWLHSNLSWGCCKCVSAGCRVGLS